METEVYPGSCLCGAVTFELAGLPTELLHCHCRMCQKSHGAVFATFARVTHEAFHFTRGEDLVQSYRSSEQACRTFCSMCGSTLQFLRDGSDTFGLAVSALDRPLEPQPVCEYHVDTRQDWLIRFDQAGVRPVTRYNHEKK